MSSAHPDLDFKPELPRRLDHGIGIVGAGGIVNYAHLPAYAQAGFKVVGITDKVRERAEKTACDHKIPKVYDSLEELLSDPEVEIVDIAVYPWETLAIGEQAVRAGKHILCQKPLADEYGKAVNLVALAREAGLKMAVNQQMRWTVGIRGTKQLLRQGWLGIPGYGTIQVHCQTDWSMWPLVYARKRVEVLNHSIHYIDSLRYLLGDPDRVFTSGSRTPGEQTQGETKTLTIWEYDSGLQVLIDVNHGVWQDDRYAIFRFEGTEGIIKGTIGLMYNYPAGRPDTLEFMSKKSMGYWFSARNDYLWIPDAFVGPMGSLMRAIEDDSEALTSGSDNLKTLQLVFAAYRSMEQGRAVSPKEIIG
ncbi:MAG TPA: Gfo/Idh/MocA family oxidoreductase [Terriglobia bacterium]|nr:Gfo/Idh/MocA family oxidoreductase [Terriglobia bacterium]